MRRSLIDIARPTVILALIVLLLNIVYAPVAAADCTIPPVGPWPPCATGSTAPVITDLQYRYEQNGTRKVILKDLYFKDSDGDAAHIDWELIEVLVGDPNQITITDGIVTSTVAEQQRGTFVTGRFTCAPHDTTTRLSMKVTIIDRAGQVSNTVYFQEDCGGSSGGSGLECVIPPSGPWPACAKGGSQSAPSPAPSNPNNGNECVIPPSGPWPACARAGSQPAPSPTPSNPNNGNECVIPPSGPWPACARGGTQSAPSPTPQPTQPEVTIDHFYVSVQHQGAGVDWLTFNWHVSNATKAVIEVYQPAEVPLEGRTRWEVSTQGSLLVTEEPYPGLSNIEISLMAWNEQGEVVVSKTEVMVNCEYSFFFTDELPYTCPSAPYQTAAAYQSFEHGFMLWVDERIFVISERFGGFDISENHSSYNFIIADTWHEGLLSTDPSIQPPAGLQQPERGFGKVWRDYSKVRDALGWAISIEQGYTTTIQKYKPYSYDITIYLLPDGRRLSTSVTSKGGYTNWSVNGPD